MRAVHQTRYGPMLVNELDRYVGKGIMLYGEFSRGEVDFFQAVIKPNMVVIDVGANIGAHTVVFAKLVGENGVVVAYEPQRLLYQMLCANVALNQLDNVFCLQKAVGAVQEAISINCVDQNQPNNFGAFSLEQLKGGDEVVDIVPLKTPCHFLKIDVEGMELQVLQGAEKMIREFQPLMYVENDRAEKSDALVAMVRELGYTPRWHVTPLFCEDNWKKVSENIWPSIYSINMICVPPGVDGFDTLDEVTCNWKEHLNGKDHA